MRSNGGHPPFKWILRRLWLLDPRKWDVRVPALSQPLLAPSSALSPASTSSPVLSAYCYDDYDHDHQFQMDVRARALSQPCYRSQLCSFYTWLIIDNTIDKKILQLATNMTNIWHLTLIWSDLDGFFWNLFQKNKWPSAGGRPILLFKIFRQYFTKSLTFKSIILL